MKKNILNKIHKKIETFTDDEWMEWLNLQEDDGTIKFGQFKQGLSKYESEVAVEFYNLLYKMSHQMNFQDAQREASYNRKTFLLFVRAYRDEYKKLYKFFLDNELLDI